MLYVVHLTYQLSVIDMIAPVLQIRQLHLRNDRQLSSGESRIQTQIFPKLSWPDSDITNRTEVCE